MADTTTFSLLGKGLKLTTAADILPHLSALESNPSPTTVQFTGNTLGIGACEALGALLATKPSIHTAKFDDIFTSRLLSEIPVALDALLQACLQLPNLHTIDLSDNAFGLNTQAPLVRFLSRHVPLRHLYLNNNGMGPHAGALIADALTELARKKAEVDGAPRLETVVCGRNRLEAGSMEAWARCYSVNTGVRVVRMVQNGIRPQGIVTLLKSGLSRAGGLEVLDLQDNTFTAKGSRALADVVGGWAALKELDVGDCLLGRSGGVMVGQALAEGKNGCLEVLKLGFDDIDPNGVKALADAVGAGKLENLRRVELNGNKFEEDDVSAEKLKGELDSRREAAGADAGDEAWGLDELDELEGEDSDEEEEAEEEDEEEDKVGEKELKMADQAEEENVAQDQDKSVDELADVLGKTEIK